MGYLNRRNFMNAYGQALAIDSGYYPAYGSPHDTLWTRSGRRIPSIKISTRSFGTSHTLAPIPASLRRRSNSWRLWFPIAPRKQSWRFSRSGHPSRWAGRLIIAGSRPGGGQARREKLRCRGWRKIAEWHWSWAKPARPALLSAGNATGLSSKSKS